MNWELTRQETVVLGLLTQGLNNTDIMAELFISRNTLKTHMSHIFSKINVTDRTQAALWAVRRGL